MQHLSMCTWLALCTVCKLQIREVDSCCSCQQQLTAKVNHPTPMRASVESSMPCLACSDAVASTGAGCSASNVYCSGALLCHVCSAHMQCEISFSLCIPVSAVYPSFTCFCSPAAAGR
jgi:hypothetical protein